ncbi:MAG: TIGR03084 family metal-binding protein [Actinomycetota bacterium]|nr:TIGR03084 family metal-binding protein [Actinomycetota bacterium]
MADLADVLADLAAEGAAIEALVDRAPDWSLATPAEGWTISHQIGHLAWTDSVAHASALGGPAWDAVMETSMADPAGVVDTAAATWAERPDLREVWAAGRLALGEALAATTTSKLPWFGPPMSPTSMATARLMETWAHGQDVADTLGVTREPTDRLRHVAHLGVRTRAFAYAVQGLQPPTDPVRVELTSPSGQSWVWGPDDAPQRVTGPALDFCLLVTQRRHRHDLALVARGDDADLWLGIAQAFAGAPGAGRPPVSAGSRG